MTIETIVAAAIRIPVSNYFSAQVWRGKPLYPQHLIITAPPPARHATLLHPISDHYRGIAGDDQGFLTSTGRYVDRYEAMRIVKAANQPMIDHPARHDLLYPDRDDNPLFSEDLW